MARANKLSVEIVTGERIVFTEDDVDMVVAPGAEGSLGVLPHHAPLITLLDNGELRIIKGGQEHSLVVFGGFMEVTHDKVIVLADTAERAEEIDVSRAETARRTAEESLQRRSRGGDLDIEQADLALARAAVRLRVGQRRGGRRSGRPGMGGETGG